MAGCLGWCSSGRSSIVYEEGMDEYNPHPPGGAICDVGEGVDKLRYEQLLPLVLDAEETAWRRGEVAMRQLSDPQSSTADLTVGSAILRHAHCVKNIHGYFSNFESRKCCLNLAGGQTRFNNIRLVREDAQDMMLEEGAYHKRQRQITPVEELASKDFVVYRHALMCARFPVLCAPEPPVLSPDPDHNPHPYNNLLPPRPVSRTLSSITESLSVTSDPDDLAGAIIPTETLCGVLRQAFGLSREQAAKYERLVFENYKRRSQDKILVEELMNQLSLLENNKHPFYNPRTFTTGMESYELWQQAERAHIFTLIKKFWHHSLPPLKKAQNYDASGYHGYYKHLITKIIRYECSVKSDTESGPILSAPLSTAALRLLKEFGLRYGIGETYRQVVYLEYLSEHFENEVWYIQHSNNVLVGILDILTTSNSSAVITQEEFNMLQKCSTVLHDQCRHSLTRIKSVFYGRRPAHGVGALIDLLGSVLKLKTFIQDRPQKSLSTLLHAYFKCGFETAYESYKAIAEGELKKDAKRNTNINLTAKLLNRLVLNMKDEIVDYKNNYQVVIQKHVDIAAVAATTFYDYLMEDVLRLCEATKQKHKEDKLDLTMVSFAYRLNQLDKEWAQYIPPQNQVWRQAFLGEARHWLIVLRYHSTKLVMEIVGSDKFEMLELHERAQYELRGRSVASESPVSYRSLQKSTNSAFSSVKPHAADRRKMSQNSGPYDSTSTQNEPIISVKVPNETQVFSRIPPTLLNTAIEDDTINPCPDGVAGHGGAKDKSSSVALSVNSPHTDNIGDLTQEVMDEERVNKGINITRRSNDPPPNILSFSQPLMAKSPSSPELLNLYRRVREINELRSNAPETEKETLSLSASLEQLLSQEPTSSLDGSEARKHVNGESENKDYKGSTETCKEQVNKPLIYQTAHESSDVRNSPNKQYDGSDKPLDGQVLSAEHAVGAAGVCDGAENLNLSVNENQQEAQSPNEAGTEQSRTEGAMYGNTTPTEQNCDAQTQRNRTNSENIVASMKTKTLTLKSVSLDTSSSSGEDASDVSGEEYPELTTVDCVENANIIAIETDNGMVFTEQGERSEEVLMKIEDKVIYKDEADNCEGTIKDKINMDKDSNNQATNIQVQKSQMNDGEYLSKQGDSENTETSQASVENEELLEAKKDVDRNVPNIEKETKKPQGEINNEEDENKSKICFAQTTEDEDKNFEEDHQDMSKMSDPAKQISHMNGEKEKLVDRPVEIKDDYFIKEEKTLNPGIEPTHTTADQNLQSKITRPKSKTMKEEKLPMEGPRRNRASTGGSTVEIETSFMDNSGGTTLASGSVIEPVMRQYFCDLRQALGEGVDEELPEPSWVDFHSSFSTPATTTTSDDLISGALPCSGGVIDVTILLQRLIRFVKTICDTIFPFSKTSEHKGSRKDVNSSQGNLMDGHGSRSEEDKSHALETKILRDYVLARQQIYKMLLQAFSRVVCLYANNTLCMDMCAMKSLEARELVGHHLLEEAQLCHRLEEVWGCRHMVQNISDCYHYHTQKAKYLADKFEPVCKAMCVRINNLSGLAAILSQMHGQTRYSMEAERLQGLVEELELVTEQDDCKDYVIVDLFPGSSGSSTPVSRPPSWSSSRSRDNNHRQDEAAIVFGHAYHHLHSVIHGLINILVFRMNLFCQEALSILLRLKLPMISVEARLRPLVEFLSRHMIALNEWLYPQYYNIVINRLWDSIVQDFESETLALQNQTENTEHQAAIILQTIAHLMRFFSRNDRGISIEKLLAKVEKITFSLQLYTQSTHRLSSLYRQMVNYLNASSSSLSCEDSDMPSTQYLRLMKSALHMTRKCFSGQTLVQWLQQHPPTTSKINIGAELSSEEQLRSIKVHETGAMQLAQKLVDRGVICNIEETSRVDRSVVQQSSSFSDPYPSISVYSHSVSYSQPDMASNQASTATLTSAPNPGRSSLTPVGGSFTSEGDTSPSDRHLGGGDYYPDTEQHRQEYDLSSDHDSSSGVYLNFNRFSTNRQSELGATNDQYKEMHQAGVRSVSSFRNRTFHESTFSTSPGPMLFRNDTRHFYHFTNILDQIEDLDIGYESDASRSNTPRNSINQSINRKAFDVYQQNNITLDFILQILQSRSKQDVSAQRFLLSLERETAAGVQIIDSDQPFLGHLGYP